MVRQINDENFCGKTTDTKPTTDEDNKPLLAGKWFLEIDTKKIYFWDGETWSYMYSY